MASDSAPNPHASPVEIEWVGDLQFDAGRPGGPRVRIDADARTSPSGRAAAAATRYSADIKPDVTQRLFAGLLILQGVASGDSQASDNLPIDNNRIAAADGDQARAMRQLRNFTVANDPGPRVRGQPEPWRNSPASTGFSTAVRVGCGSRETASPLPERGSPSAPLDSTNESSTNTLGAGSSAMRAPLSVAFFKRTRNGSAMRGTAGVAVELDDYHVPLFYGFWVNGGSDTERFNAEREFDDLGCNGEQPTYSVRLTRLASPRLRRILEAVALGVGLCIS